MQLVAREMNLSETAFLEERGGDWHIRWFTPAGEVDLCGHATLASAHALWESGRIPGSEPIRFHSRGGPLSATRDDTLIWLDFPARPVDELGAGDETRTAILDALAGGGDCAGSVSFVGSNGMDAFVQFKDGRDVLDFQPDFPRIAALPFRGLILTARPPEAADHHFVSRFFAPKAGVNEDPVTGSAHCALGPFWSNLLGEEALTGYQASPRGGTVETRIKGARVLLGGKAVTILRGTLEPT